MSDEIISNEEGARAEGSCGFGRIMTAMALTLLVLLLVIVAIGAVQATMTGERSPFMFELAIYFGEVSFFIVLAFMIVYALKKRNLAERER